MKQVFYSELLDKYFDTDTQCQKEELAYQAKQEEARKKEIAAQEAANNISKEKKELSRVIEQADNTLNTAYEDLAVAKEKVRKILEDSNKEMRQILEPAQAAVREAQRKKLEAVANFNHKYGPYTVKYTGDRALSELERSNSWTDDFIDTLFRNFR